MWTTFDLRPDMDGGMLQNYYVECEIGRSMGSGPMNKATWGRLLPDTMQDPWGDLAKKMGIVDGECGAWRNVTYQKSHMEQIVSLQVFRFPPLACRFVTNIHSLTHTYSFVIIVIINIIKFLLSSYVTKEK